MSDGLNIVPVLQTHLEELERTLVFVEGLLVSLDLQSDYRSVSTVPSRSKLTMRVQDQQNRVRGYLEQEDPDG